MGPNGAGKSTLANVILNNPEYTKTSGTVEFEGENINDYVISIARRNTWNFNNELFKICKK